MKTADTADLVDDPKLIAKYSKRGENIVITDRGRPVAILIPFDDSLGQLGVKLDLALKLFSDKTIGLSKAAKIANMSIEQFLGAIKPFELEVCDFPEGELLDELKGLDIEPSTKGN